MKNRKFNSTVVMSDIRNFTSLFEKYQDIENHQYNTLINRYYHAHMEVADIFDTDTTHLSSTGDGIMSIFHNETHAMTGYAYSIIVYKLLNIIFDKFNKWQDDHVHMNILSGFGIGVDSGTVYNLSMKSKSHSIETSLASAINRAARIEEATKSFGDTNLIIGENTFNILVENLFPEFHNNLELYDHNYDKLLSDKMSLINICSELKAFFIQKFVLKGISKPLAIFRLSHSMIMEDEHFYDILVKLINPSLIEPIKKLIHIYETY